MSDILCVSDPASKESWLLRSLAQAGCQRKQEVYGASFNEKDWTWLEIRLPWNLRATRKFWPKIIGGIKTQGCWGYPNRLFAKLRPDEVLGVWSSAKEYATTLLNVSVPKTTGVRVERPFGDLAKSTSSYMWLGQLLEATLKTEFGLSGILVFDEDSFKTGLADLSSPVVHTNLKPLENEQLWREVDYSALIMNRKVSWGWIQRKYPSFCGLVTLISYAITAEGNSIIRFKMLNDDRFLNESNRGKTSLLIGWGEMRMSFCDGQWSLLQTLIEDSYSLWTSALQYIDE